jgi:hypothetical protein
LQLVCDLLLLAIYPLAADLSIREVISGRQYRLTEVDPDLNHGAGRRSGDRTTAQQRQEPGAT